MKLLHRPPTAIDQGPNTGDPSQDMTSQNPPYNSTKPELLTVLGGFWMVAVNSQTHPNPTPCSEHPLWDPGFRPRLIAHRHPRGLCTTIPKHRNTIKPLVSTRPQIHGLHFMFAMPRLSSSKFKRQET